MSAPNSTSESTLRHRVHNITNDLKTSDNNNTTDNESNQNEDDIFEIDNIKLDNFIDIISNWNIFSACTTVGNTITNKISEGDVTLRAPLKEHDETYSLAISFNTMLDHLQLTQESLEKSLELLHEKQAQLVESEKRASMGFLVSGVAHELNNPLNNISLTAETMIEDMDELSHDELKGYIMDVFIQSERAHNIVENLLDFARARRSTEMEKLDLIQIVKGSIKLIANQLMVNNIKLQQDIPDGALYIKGNLSKLEQILVNIILNAIHAMKDSGTLTISIKPDAENKNIFIKISDTGPGIPKENLKNIFEPFFTTKPVGKGTGLGLSVTRTLVAEHSGEIKIESKLGVGTTFIIILPLYEETA